MTARRIAVYAVVAVAAFVAGLAIARALSRPAAPPPDLTALLWPSPKAIAPFSLVDQDGKPFDVERLRGQWTVMFFGYTHCPDVCPTTLSTLAAVHDALASGGDAERLAVIMVSVDPARDTPERLGQYVRFFGKDFIGVTGPLPDVDVLTRQLGILYVHHQPEASGGYLVDHSAGILLVDPQARLVGLFSPPHEAAEIARQVRGIRAFIEG
ncbi:MAG: SCO family protein [Ectothiorhodospiraceae bacterium]|nr:SCO family protein [Chromatiales bacterium]MCP5153793.1 SCO family protein [Ectothiorhodospiraceae bacterium]